MDCPARSFVIDYENLCQKFLPENLEAKYCSFEFHLFVRLGSGEALKKRFSDERTFKVHEAASALKQSADAALTLWLMENHRNLSKPIAIVTGSDEFYPAFIEELKARKI